MRRHIYVSWLIISVFSLNILDAQNRDEFFKTNPGTSLEDPAWVQLMYSEDPSVLEVDKLYRDFYAKTPFEKTTHTQNYKHWRRIVEPFINDEGFIRLPSKEEENLRSRLLKQRYLQRAEVEKNPGTDMQWVNMGPIETFRQNTLTPVSWHKNVYSFDQSLSHPNVLICGTEAGGVYKSRDRGMQWNLINAGEVFVGGNEAVEIHPADTNVFLAASNRRIYRSTNSGQSWTEEHFMDGSGYEFRFHPVNHDTVFCTGSQGLFRSNDRGDNWTQIFSDRCWDIDFHPNNPDTVYLLKTNPTAKRAEFFRSENAGTSWTLKANGWFSPSDLTNAYDDGGKIGITPASPDMVYVCLIGAGKSGDGGWIGIYRSDNKGDSWMNPVGQDGSPYGSINGSLPWNVSAYSSGTQQGWFNFDMEVSDTDPGRLWVGTIRLSESSDSGKTFISIGAANSQRHSNIHADIQDIDVQNGEIWVASDGGVDVSTDSLQTYIPRNHGIRTSHFWGFGSGWNIDSYCGGRYHDGTIGWHEGFGIGNVYNIGGVEEASGYVHPMDGKRMLFRTHYASSQTSVKVLPDTLGGTVVSLASFPLRPNEHYVQSRSSGVYFHPLYANHILIGLDSILYRSTNGGISFDAIHTFPGNGKVLEIAWSRSNPNVIYLVNMSTAGVWDLCQIFKSIDGGTSWAATTNLPADRREIEITVNPFDENEIWAAAIRGGNGNMIYRSTNGGSSWANMTPSILDGEELSDILFQSSGTVYVTSHNGVFYRNQATGNWVDFSLGLPLIAKSLKVNPFYRDAELRLASHGRGVFARKMAALGVNDKHSDCDGNGIVAAADTIAISQNFGLRHRSFKNGGNGVPVRMNIAGARTSFLAGDTVRYDVHWGDMQNMVNDAHGLAFTVAYDTSLWDQTSLQTLFEPSFLGTPGSSVLTMRYHDPVQGILSMGWTRTDRNPQSGFGKMGGVIIVLDDDISKRTIPISWEVLEVLALDNLGNSIADWAQVDTINATVTTSLQPGIAQSPWTLFPNPGSGDGLKLSYEVSDRKTSVQVMDMLGKQILTKPLELGASHHYIPTGSLKPGVYIEVIKTFFNSKKKLRYL
jgi:photosystem II stability/assembly factor-like uncharacterized protein